MRSKGCSFEEMSAETGVSVNTLLSRKHHAVFHLRKPACDPIYEEFGKSEENES